MWYMNSHRMRIRFHLFPCPMLACSCFNSPGDFLRAYLPALRSTRKPSCLRWIQFC